MTGTWHERARELVKQCCARATDREIESAAQKIVEQLQKVWRPPYVQPPVGRGDLRITFLVATAFCVSLSTAASAQMDSFSQGFYEGFSQGSNNTYVVPCCHRYDQGTMPLYNPPVYNPPQRNCTTISLGRGIFTTSCQ